MGNLIAPAKPDAATRGDAPSKCEACHHEREGITMAAWVNKRLLRKGQELKRPTCSSAHDMFMGDVDECGCDDPSHSERLVKEPRYL